MNNIAHKHTSYYTVLYIWGVNWEGNKPNIKKKANQNPISLHITKPFQILQECFIQNQFLGSSSFLNDSGIKSNYFSLLLTNKFSETIFCWIGKHCEVRRKCNLKSKRLRSWECLRMPVAF